MRIVRRIAGVAPGAALVASALAAAGCFDFGRPFSADANVATDSTMGTTDAMPDASPGTDASECISGCSTLCPVDDTVATANYATEVEPVFAANCAVGACHVSDTGLGAGEVLIPGAVCMSTVGITAMQTSGTSMMPRITPGDPEASYLFHKIRGTHRDVPTPDGIGCRMPLGDCCLTDVELGTIRRWILDGAMCN